MGLIKAISGAVSSTLADQWKEYFMCEAIDKDVLMVKGVKKTGSNSSNTKGSDNIISNGSVIAVADGQCMLIVEQGKVVEVCAEPGAFTYDSSSEPSIFYGSLGESIINSFKTVGKRFTFGGDVGNDQRVYYMNLKEILANKYGTATPVPFRVVDNNIGLDIDIAIRCNGEYSYKITDPILFYTNVCGNVSVQYDRSEIDSMLKTELMTALQPAFAKISDMGIRYSSLPGHTEELSTALNEILSAKWKDLRGLEIVSFGVNSVSAPKEDEDMIKELQRTAVYRNANMAAARMADAQAEAMVAAAGNEGAGAMMGFMGMNMAQNAGGMNATQLFQMGQQQQPQQQAPQQQAPMQQAPQQQAPQQTAPAAGGWTCACGATNTGKFCMECGGKAPVSNEWTCACGTTNTGKFCMECGQSASPKTFQCDKCGWKPEDQTKVPKFCPECGDIFDEHDRK
ncbi:MAG: SPFH domain-containing protein [Eubacteriales bacterium]